VIDQEGRYVKAAPTKWQFTYNPAELVGKTVHDIFPKKEADTLFEQLQRSLKENRTVSFEQPLHFGQKEIWFDACMSPMNETSVLYIGRANTERRALADQLRQSQKMEAVGQLAGGVAHDFNNLLTVIGGYTDLTIAKLQKDDPVRQHLTEIQKAIVRASALTRQLLAFGRKQITQAKPLVLNSVVLDLGKMLWRLIGEDIELRTLLEPELGSINADAGQMEQIIINLIVNARDAMPNGGALTIETRNVDSSDGSTGLHLGLDKGPNVMLSITDTGVGMDSETIARIFEPFFTTKQPGKGTGLGLSTVYGIVQQSGGRILVYSEIGRGTTFKMYFPRIVSSAKEDERSTARQETQHGTETVLLAEDDGMVRHLARSVLDYYGYHVLEAANGEEAIQISERHEAPIQLLITDVVMPQMSGPVLFEQIVKSRPQIKVLFMSGYSGSAVTHQLLLDEMTAFIKKPFTPDALARKVRDVLDGAS
jgi:two-component system, cell cycle sensor histidine kinase and response regulator CckA